MSPGRAKSLRPEGSHHYYRRVELAILLSVAVHAAAIPLVPPYVARPYKLDAPPLRLVAGGHGGSGEQASVAPGETRTAAPPARYRSAVIVTEQLRVPPTAVPSGSSGLATRGGPGAPGGSEFGGEEGPPPVFYAFDSPPKVLASIVPEYPAAAKSQVAEGSVVLNANVDERGRVIRVWVAQATAAEALVEAAVDALYRFRFSPGSQQGVPVKCTVAVPFNFRLNIHQ